MPQFVKNLLQSEPVVTISFVGAAIALAVSFGVNFSDDQINAIKDFVANALIFAGVVAGIRQSVYAPDSHREAVEAAVDHAIDAHDAAAQG